MLRMDMTDAGSRGTRAEVGGAILVEFARAAEVESLRGAGARGWTVEGGIRKSLVGVGGCWDVRIMSCVEIRRL